MLSHLIKLLKINRQKGEILVFYLLLFAIPFQTRKILFQSGWGFNEWRSFSVYFTDILFIALLMIWVINKVNLRPELRSRESQPSSRAQVEGKSTFVPSSGRGKVKITIQNLKFLKSDTFLLIFLGVALLSIKNSTDTKLSLFSFLRLMEFAALYFYIKSNAVRLLANGYWLLAILAGGLFQSLIAIAQFLKQSAIGLRFLGESVIAPDMEGVAVFYNSVGEKVMRAYGTTPHPNILAAYLLLSIFCFYYLSFAKIKYYWLLVIGYSLVLFGFFATFSRITIFIWLLAALALVMLVKRKWRAEYKAAIFKIIIATAVTSVIFVAAFWPAVSARIKISGGDEAVKFRVFYNKEALRSGSGILNINWLGVGTGNFVNWLMKYDNKLPRYMYQPVHNIYLLLYSETGILGAGAFVLFVLALIKNFMAKRKPISLESAFILTIVLSILTIGFFDHFPWTLQQGRLMLWLSLAGLTL